MSKPFFPLCLVVCACAVSAAAQSLGNSGTVQGTVTDPSGAAIPNAKVEMRNPVSGYSQAVATNADGLFRFNNVPLNQYHVAVTVPGFTKYDTDVDVRTPVPIVLPKVQLTVAVAQTSVTVEAAGQDLVELDPSAHVDTDRNALSKLPLSDPGGGLSQAVVYSTGGVAADSNGLFHPLGDHAQVTFVIDGQPISDQQSKVFSTQLPTSAIQNMELDTGAPNAEFGDKTSLVAQITTRSGLGAGHVFGNVDTSYGGFGTAGTSIGLGFGNAKLGNFLAMESSRSGRFLDTPELAAFHDKGNNESIFDRFDYLAGAKDVFHLNLFAARNWIQIPNSYDQLSQDQHQRVLSWSVAPGYQHTFNARTLLTVNPYVRKDQFDYYPSRNPFADSPATQSQDRHLMDWGVKADLSQIKGKHNIKYGIDLKQTRLFERFAFGITDPNFNPVCVDSSGASAGASSVLNPDACTAQGLMPNPNLNPGLVPYDLTRGGQLLQFTGAKNINQYAFYLQDSITLGNLVFNLGLRGDIYQGIVSASGVDPRIGVAYHVKKTGTVLRGAYSRTFETPFNENLLLSSATGTGGLAANVFGSQSVPIQPGVRNQYNVGLQQALRKWLLLDADYFWKYTTNAFDFSTLLNTTITFPISWKQSKLDGVTGRISTTNLRGFQTYWTFGHTRARFFPPELGGLVPQGAPLAGGVFRIDHDQALQSTVLTRYQRPKNAEWISFSWRFDSGLVVSGVPDVAAVLGLTAAQQVAIGFACNGVPATYGQAIAACSGKGTSTLLTLPQTGQENDDHNPDRVKPRSLLNVGVGTDNLLHVEGRRRIEASFEISNLTNVTALYNFLSTFSGTHFVAPRIMMAKVGFSF